MSIETVARQALYRQASARGGDLRSLADRALLKRVWRLAERHHRRLGGFVAVSVVAALLTVATPVLAGKVVDAIVEGRPVGTVVLLAAVIAIVAIGEAAVSLVTRAVGQHRRGPDPGPAHGGVRPCAAHADRVLHSHPHRRVGQPTR